MTHPAEGPQPLPVPLEGGLQPTGMAEPLEAIRPAKHAPDRPDTTRLRRAVSRVVIGLLDLASGGAIVAVFVLPGSIAAVHSLAPRVSALQLLLDMVCGGTAHPPTFASLSIGIAILMFGLGAALTRLAAAAEALLGNPNGPLAVIAANLTWVLGALVLALASLHEFVVPWLASAVFDAEAIRLDLGWAGVACLVVGALGAVRAALASVSGSRADRASRAFQLFVAASVGVAVFAAGVLDESLSSTGLTVASLAVPGLWAATGSVSGPAWALAALVVLSVVAVLGLGRSRRGSSRWATALIGALFSATLGAAAALLVTFNLAYSAAGTAESVSWVIPFRPANWYLISALVLSLSLVASAFLPGRSRPAAEPAAADGGSPA